MAIRETKEETRKISGLLLAPAAALTLGPAASVEFCILLVMAKGEATDDEK